MTQANTPATNSPLFINSIDKDPVVFIKSFFETNNEESLAWGLRALGIKAVAFDMDGTLVDTEDFCIENIVRVVNSELSSPLTNEEILSMPIGQRTLPILRTLLGSRGIAEEYLQEIKKKITASYQAGLKEAIHKGQINSFPKPISLVKALRNQDFSLSIVTSNTKARADQQVEKNSLSDHFEFIISKESVDESKDPNAKSKPDPFVYKEAIKSFNCKSSELLVIEDSNSGIEAATAAGAMVVAIRNKINQQAISLKNLALEQVYMLDLTSL